MDTLFVGIVSHETDRCEDSEVYQVCLIQKSTLAEAEGALEEYVRKEWSHLLETGELLYFVREIPISAGQPVLCLN
jgi:hypothetical protein